MSKLQSNKIYKGMSGSSVGQVGALSATDNKLKKLNKLARTREGYALGQVGNITASVVSSGGGGRKLKKDLLPPVRKRSAREYR